MSMKAFLLFILLIALFLIQVVINDSIWQGFKDASDQSKCVYLAIIAVGSLLVWFVFLLPFIKVVFREEVWVYIEGTLQAFAAYMFATVIYQICYTYICKDYDCRTTTGIWIAVAMFGSVALVYYYTNVWHCCRSRKRL